MGFFSNLFGRKKKERESVIIGSLPAIAFGGGTQPVAVNGDAALGVTAYKRALDVLAGSVARLPFVYMKKKSGVYVEDERSPLHYLLRVQPQERMSAFDWKFQLIWRAVHDGNAYIYPRIIDGEVSELVLLSRNSVTLDETNGLYSVADMFNGVFGTFPGNAIIHVAFNSVDGRKGVPLWVTGREALSIIATGDRETLERFDKGGAVRGFITNDRTGLRGIGEYQDQELASLASSTDNMFKRGDRIVSLPGDAGFIQVSASSSDMQFLETRKFSVSENSRLTGVPPIYLFADSSSNYKVPEQSDTAYLTQTLDRILTAIECEFQRKLVPASLCCKRRFEFDRKRIFSMDLNSMALYEQRMIQNGVYTVNDIRQMENQAPVEGGDKVYISTNLAELGSEKLSFNGSAENDSEEQ